jgi:hypothetical protein
MKKFLVVAVSLSALLCTTTAFAEKTDCETLVQLGSSLDDIRTGLNNGEEVDEETYDVLADVVTALRNVAEQEGNSKLDSALDRLEQAHSDNDRAAYVAALESVDTVFGGLYNAECGE